MSDGTQGTAAATGLMSGTVTAWFAPVDATTGAVLPFDASVSGRLPVSTPPAGWRSAGPVEGFVRSSAVAMTEVRSGSPAVARLLAQHTVDAKVSFELTQWSRLAMMVSCGTRLLNVLEGGVVALLASSTATTLQVTGGLAAGDVVVVDDDYAGQTGAIGAGITGAVIAAGSTIADANYVRRVSSNVALVQTVAGSVVTLAQPLPAGTPTATMKAMKVAGFADRVGDSATRQWSAVFVVDGAQGERLLLHYPRLQVTAAGETAATVADGVERRRLVAEMSALPEADGLDGVQVLCTRTYLPAAMRTV